MPAIVQGYPTTRYTAPLRPLPDFTSKAERERMTGPALRTFFYIIERWEIPDEDARELLGGVCNGRYYQMKKDKERRILSADELFRISYLIGTFNALNTLHGQSLADRWVRLPNSNRIFNGLAPLEYMRKGGQFAMEIARELLEALIQGNITGLPETFPGYRNRLKSLARPAS
jgi:hypothetical protein